jgi:hypothetical protein
MPSDQDWYSAKMLDPCSLHWPKTFTAVLLPVDHVIGDPARLPQRGSQGQPREYIPTGSNMQFYETRNLNSYYTLISRQVWYRLEVSNFSPTDTRTRIL